MNKISVTLTIPLLDLEYDLLIPINKKVSCMINLVEKGLNEITDNAFPINHRHVIYNLDSGNSLDLNKTIREENLQNGTKLMIV